MVAESTCACHLNIIYWCNSWCHWKFVTYICKLPGIFQLQIALVVTSKTLAGAHQHMTNGDLTNDLAVHRAVDGCQLSSA